VSRRIFDLSARTYKKAIVAGRKLPGVLPRSLPFVLCYRKENDGGVLRRAGKFDHLGRCERRIEGRDLVAIQNVRRLVFLPFSRR